MKPQVIEVFAIGGIPRVEVAEIIINDWRAPIQVRPVPQQQRGSR